MAAYLVLARKYRSATFDEVVGQEHVAETLKNAITSGRVAHAFLFTGTRGVGKTTMARILAKALNCLKADGPTVTPCNKCEACIAIARGDDMDVVEIDGASNRGIDEIRELRSNAIYRPSRCRYKVYYIDEVHMLTKEAFNALLKTLEEPPGHVKFMFATTEPQRVPATIVSRCQRFDFRNIPTAQIASHLERVCEAEKVKAEKGAIFRIARSAAGSMRDGLSLLDQLLAGGEGMVTEADVGRILGTPGEERTAEIVAAIADGDAAAALTGLDGLLQSGVTIDSAINAIGEMFRHMMLAATCGSDSELIELPDSQRGQVAELTEKFTLPALVQCVTACQTTARNLRGLTSGRGLAEAALVRLGAWEKFVDAESLVARLEGLSGGAGRTSPPRQAPGGGQKKKAVAAPEARPAGGDRSRGRRPPAARRPATTPSVPPGTYAPARPAEAPPEPAEAVLENPQWSQEYVASNWSGIVSVLAAGGRGQLAGHLSPAKVLALAGETLSLGYDQAHEAIRRRCVERMDEQIAVALGDLFGRRVTCKYVATGEPGEPLRQENVSLVLSSAERAEIAADPAVKDVLEFFDGSIVNVRPEAPSADEADAEKE